MTSKDYKMLLAIIQQRRNIEAVNGRISGATVCDKIEAVIKDTFKLKLKTGLTVLPTKNHNNII